MPTAQALREIEERAEKATPGPWHAADDGVIWHETLMDQSCCGNGLPVWNSAGTEIVGQECCGQPNVSGGQEALGQSSGDNAQFMAHARTDIPALLADRKALVELLTSALPYVDPDDVLYSADGKARVRALHNKIRAALQEDR